ncbi:glycosyltransferase family 2 protein [Candidatus Margulisiibacteriota bacterium]
MTDEGQPLEVDWLSGACLLVPKSVIDRVGLLDEDFFMYWEDADWCKRIKDAGYKIVWLPTAEIYHHAGQSSKQVRVRSIIEFNKSVYKYYKKHYDRQNIILNIFVVLGLTIRVLAKLVYSYLKK